MSYLALSMKITEAMSQTMINPLLYNISVKKVYIFIYLVDLYLPVK